uniref:DUF7722 domain-containing protein n=1 Tax=Kalanchoe fedtschenkoi TaxID=63787 RepID=A0A7N0U2F3_KALFE
MIVGMNPSAVGVVEAVAPAAQPPVIKGAAVKQQQCVHFQMPLHYPRYARADYEIMPEWKLDCLLAEYGLPLTGDVEHKRKFAMGAFLWVL